MRLSMVLNDLKAIYFFFTLLALRAIARCYGSKMKEAIDKILKLKREADSKMILIISASCMRFAPEIVAEAKDRGVRIVGFSTRAALSSIDGEFKEVVGGHVHLSTKAQGWHMETAMDGLSKALESVGIQTDARTIRDMDYFQTQKVYNIFTFPSEEDEEDWDDWD